MEEIESKKAREMKKNKKRVSMARKWCSGGG
jgi:hypothetical protein